VVVRRHAKLFYIDVEFMREISYETTPLNIDGDIVVSTAIGQVKKC
jgi:hypothetical protein